MDETVFGKHYIVSKMDGKPVISRKNRRFFRSFLLNWTFLHLVTAIMSITIPFLLRPTSLTRAFEAAGGVCGL